MQFEQDAGSGFAYEMMNTMVSATEIFNTVLLNNLKKYFHIKNAFITVFDFKGNFLSLTDLNKIYIGAEHPYSQIADRDVCAKKIIDECRRDGLWHDNLKPYIYRSSDLLARNDTQVSDYVYFLREIIQAETPEIYAENRRHTIPGLAVLIQDKELGNVLWDTGITEDWEKTWTPKFKEDYTFRRLNHLKDKLVELQLTVDDIDLLICCFLYSEGIRPASSVW